MYRNRKRKVSPDKKSDKSKKLKVSSKIFRSPSSTKTNSEAKSKLSKLLPEGYDSIILTANTKPVESFEENEAVFGCVRLPILTKEDAMVWVKKFERKTFSSYRTQKTWKKDVNTGLFKRKYICNVRNKDVAGQAVAATCKGSIIFTIKDQEEIQANPDYYLRDYPSQVIIHFCHNHKIDPDSYMKNLRPSAELRIIFGTYFAKGHSPFSALICHKSDLHSSYGAEFYNVVSNGAICPSYNWCFHEYEKFFMRKFIEPSDEKLNEKLKDTVTQYNARWRSECAIISYNPSFVLSICTPLMKSIFRSGFAEELITVRCFSTPKTVPKKQKLILFLCHTPIGSLPFGVVVSFAEDTENICDGIRALIKMFGVATYSPKTIIIDENALVSKALKRCFPNAQVLFNEFQMLQSIWRIIRVVCIEDDEEFQALYNLFLVTLNSSSEEEFKKNFDSLLIYAEKYPKLTNFLKYFKVRSNSYVLYARPKIEFNTDVLNYTDSGTIILQDVSIKYGNFFNIVQLFDFLSKSYVDHYERKLNKIVEGDLKGFFKTNFYVPLSKIADFTCEKISDTEFLVSLNEMKFFVNAELDTCTCQVGVHGGSCVHQYIVEKNLGLVPECYTPLCDDMLGIFKNILREKSIKPPLPDSDRLSELGSALDSLKSELDTFAQDPDDFSDIVSSVCCSEISNFSGMPHDMDHLGPLDEIFLVPPDINDSFTDITDEMMSPLVLSEFDDTNEDNEDFFDDSQQYNRESGELEPIESSNSTQCQNNVLVDGFPASLEQSIPTTGLFLNPDNTENVIIYEYTEDDIKYNNEVEVVEHCDTVAGETLVHLPADGSLVLSTDVEGYNITENISTGVDSSVVYTYSGGNQAKVSFYEDVMTENDRKTAEIAEFLTNLPDTNNSNNHLTATKHSSHHLIDASNVHSQKLNTTPYISGKGRTTEQDQTITNGVVVVTNEEYFTDYKVLDNNILSIVTKGNDTFRNNVKENISHSENFEATAQHSTHNLITDSYEENSFIMMSPNDLFDDNQNMEPDLNSEKQDVKINVLSSVVLKPPANTPKFPLNLNAIKHKTLRNVKEDSRIRMNEQRITQSGNTIFVHDPLKSEPRKIVLPIIIKNESHNLMGIRNSQDTSNQKHEHDVIKLYCNQSGEKSVPEDNEQDETKAFQQEVLVSKTPLEEFTEENLGKEEALLPLTQVLAQSESASRALNEYLSEKEVSSSEELALVECDSNDDSQEFDQDVSDPESDKNVLHSEELILPDCDPEELAKHDFVEIVEMDSDGLEELASQTYDPVLMSPEIPSKPASSQSLLSRNSSLKVTPLKNVPSQILHFKSFSSENTSVTGHCMSLRDFMTKIAPSKVPFQQKLSSIANEKQSTKSKITHNLNQNIEEYDETAEHSITNTSLERILGITNDNKKVKLDRDEKHERALMNTKQLRDKNKGRLLDTTNDNIQKLDNTRYHENKEKISRNNRENSSGLNIKQSRIIKDKVKGTNNQTKMSKETNLSDFEDLSDDCESGSSSRVDDLSEDELYELQYLSEDDSSDESSDGFDRLGTTYKERVRRKLSNKLGVRALKKTEVSASKNRQSDDKSSDESTDHIGLSSAATRRKLQLNLPPGIRLAPIKHKTKRLIVNENDDSDDSSSNESNLTNKNQVRNKLPSNLQPKIRYVGAQNSNKLKGKMVKKNNKYINKNRPSDDDSCDNLTDSGGVSSKRDEHIKVNLHQNLPRTNKLNIKSQIPQSDEDDFDRLNDSGRLSRIISKSRDKLPPKPNSDMESTSKTQKIAKLNVRTSRSTKKSISETPTETNREENANESGSFSGNTGGFTKDIGRKERLNRTWLGDSVNENTKQVTNKKVSMNVFTQATEQNIKLGTKPAEIEEIKNTDMALKKSDQNLVLADKSVNICTDQTDKSNTNLPPNKTKQRLNPKIFNNKNKKFSNTTLKLDSLPSILSQAYNQRILKEHKIQRLNERADNTAVKGKTSKVVCNIGNDVRIIAVKKGIKRSLPRNSVRQKVQDELMVSPSITNDSLISHQNETDTSISCQAGKIVNDCNLEENSRTVQAKVNIGKRRNKKNMKKSSHKNSVPQVVKDELLSSLSLPSHSRSIETTTPKSSSNLFTAEPTINNACNEMENFKLKPATLTVGLEKIRFYEKPESQMGKDIKDLEAILTNDNDIDHTLFTDVNNKNVGRSIYETSILQDTDLSFLFDDPRFEAVIEEDTLPPLSGESFAGITSAQSTNTNIASGKNLLNWGEKGVSTLEKSDESVRKYDDNLNASLDQMPEVSTNKESYSDQKNLQENNSLTECSNMNTNTLETPGLNQAGQNHLITLLVYANVPKSNTPNIPLGKDRPNTRNRPENNTLQGESPIRLMANTSNQNLKKDDSFLNKTKNDLKESSKIVDSLENESYVRDIHIQQSNQVALEQRAGTSGSKVDKLELLRKKTVMQPNEENRITYRTRRSTSNGRNIKETLITKKENTLDIKPKSGYRADVETPKKKGEDTYKIFKGLKTTTPDLTHPRRSSRGEISLNREIKKSQMQQVNLPKKELSNKSTKTRRGNKKKENLKQDDAAFILENENQVSPAKKVQNDKSQEYMETRSKISSKKEKMRRSTNLLQKETSGAIKAVKGQKQNQHKGDVAIRNVSSNTEKTVSDRHEDLLPKKGTYNTVQTDNIRKSKKGTKQSVRKGSLLLEAKSLSSSSAASDSASLSKLVQTSTRESFSNLSMTSLTHDYDESDDFENSIVASVLEKQQTPKRSLKSNEIKEKPLVLSTLKKSIDYEDAFKKFLETSNRSRINTQFFQSVSDCEKDYDDSDWESNAGSRRRTRSVSNPKKQTDTKKRVSGKMKKSVSWAEGLNIIEYVQESDSDSNDSEIRDISKKNEFARKRRKEPSNQKRSRIQNSYVSRETNVSNGKQLYSPVTSTTIFQGRSLAQTKRPSILSNRSRRSRSSSPKGDNVKTISRKRSQSYTRVNNCDPKLVVVLERNKKIELMCHVLDNLKRGTLRSRHSGRVGYKELLHRARLSKMF